MSTILDKIISHKSKTVNTNKELFPIKLLEKSIYFNTTTVSLTKYLKREDKSGIIAEFKRSSPSKGDINLYADIENVSIGYMQAGASALSVLTDSKFFGGKNEDLSVARKYNYCPILRKDFIIDEYQVVEARSIGADAILLIAACLDTKLLNNLAALAKSLGLQTIMEIHEKKEINKLNQHIDIVGVNNRDLKSFKVSVNTSLNLSNEIPKELIKISESGIDEPETIISLKNAGYNGFLIGEYFMKHSIPQLACEKLIKRLRMNND